MMQNWLMQKAFLFNIVAVVTCLFSLYETTIIILISLLPSGSKMGNIQEVGRFPETD